MRLTTISSLTLAAALIGTTSLALASPIYNPDNPNWTTWDTAARASATAAAPQAGQFAARQFRPGTNQPEKVVELKDGSAVYIFENGKMGMENGYGGAAQMKPGEVMETKDGHKLIMVGDEVSRVESLKNRESR